MRRSQKPESDEERLVRQLREDQMKRASAVAEDAAVDRMIRQNIAQFGP